MNYEQLLKMQKAETAKLQAQLATLKNTHGYSNLEQSPEEALKALLDYLPTTTGGAHYDWVCTIARVAKHQVENDKHFTEDDLSEMARAATESYYRGDDLEQQLLNNLRFSIAHQDQKESK